MFGLKFLSKKKRTAVPENDSPQVTNPSMAADVTDAGGKEEKRILEAEYLGRFIKAGGFPAHSGKSVHIRKEHHERIKRITHVIGGGKVPLSAYIDNVLARHFEENAEVILRLYEENYPKPY